MKRPPCPVQIGLVLLLLPLARGTTNAEPSLQLEAGATTHHGDDMASEPGFTFGGSFALARWAPSEHFALAPHLELLFARRNTSLTLAGVDQASLSMDSLEMPLVLRGELTLAGRTFYALGGGYGGLLLRAQAMKADGVVDRADTSRTTDIGLLAGLGFELASFSWGEVFVETRYQRSYRAVLADGGSQPELFSVLLGYGLGSDSSPSLSSWTRARSLALKGGFVATRAATEVGSEYGPGVSFGAAFSPARLGSRIALVPQLEALFVHRSTAGQTPAAESLAFDSMDSSFLLRGELSLANKAVYGVGGAYTSVLLRAQHTRDGVTTDVRDTLRSFDVGWTAGAGIEITAAAQTRLALEVRYQRSLREVATTDAVPGNQDTLFCLFGVSHGGVPRPSSGPTLPSHGADATGTVYSSGDRTGGSANKKSGVRVADSTVMIGRVGDQWLHTLQFTYVGRATHDGVFGYLIRYDIPGHGTVEFFWPRGAIDFSDRPRGSRLNTMKLRKGRLRYPKHITRRSLPDVHRAILSIEGDYAKQADGVIAAMEGFALIAGIGAVKPSLRTTTPRTKPTAPASRTRTPRAKPTSPARTSQQATVRQAAAQTTKVKVTKPALTISKAAGPSSRALGRALEAAGHVRPPGAAAHHIVAGRASGAEPAREVLRRFGIGINDAANGVFLPASTATRNGARAAVHSRLHTHAYYRAVNRRLGRAKTRQQVLDILEAIRQALLGGGL